MKTNEQHDYGAAKRSMTRRGRILARASVCTVGVALACASWGDSAGEGAASVDGSGFRSGSAEEGSGEGADPCDLLVVEDGGGCGGDSRRLVQLPQPAKGQGKPECPPHSGWKLVEAFTVDVAQHVERFCAYERAKGADDEEWTKSGEWRADCAVALQGESPLENLEGRWNGLQRSWYGSPAETYTALDSIEASADPEARLHPVTVAVIDTAGPDRGDAGGGHGYLMARLVEQANLGRATVLTYAGLPRELGASGSLGSSAGPRGGGGSVGYMSDVARAIDAAVDDWQAAVKESERGESPKLIINLSLAWKPPPSGCGVVDGEKQAHHDPVYAAIERASQLGALVLAASGNESALACGGGQPVEFAPGCWERRPTAYGEPESSYAPLVYAISPVSDGRRSLSSSPLRTHTRHAAYGYQGVDERGGRLEPTPTPNQIAPHLLGARSGEGPGVAPSVFGYSPVEPPTGSLEALALPGGGDPRAQVAVPAEEPPPRVVTGPMSGSSVSTAVESGVAALVWALDPSMDASAVMEHLRKSGRPVVGSTQAQLGLASSASKTRTVSARCLAVAPMISARLGEPFECEEPKPSGAAGNAGFPDHRTMIERAAAEETCSTGCGERSLFFDPSWPPESMPDSIVGPQPDHPPCPPCYVDDDPPGETDAAVFLKLGADYSTMQFEGVLVSIFNADGTASEHHYYRAAELSLSDPFGTLNAVLDPALAGVGPNDEAVADAEIRVDFYDSATQRVIGVEAVLPLGPPT